MYINRATRVMVILVLCFGAVLLAKNTGLQNMALPKSSNVVSINNLVSGNANISNNSNSVSFPNPKTTTTSINIHIGNILKSSPISPLDYGANVVWYDGGYGIQIWQLTNFTQTLLI